jgi:hypothetical protein
MSDAGRLKKASRTEVCATGRASFVSVGTMTEQEIEPMERIFRADYTREGDDF